MRLTILGSGGSGGVPMLSVGWGRCDPSEPRNRRTRPSIMVEDGQPDVEGKGVRILVDTSPDLREQLLRAEVRRLDAVLYTHSHADHVHGIDELREVNRLMQKGIPCWSDEPTLENLRRSFGYVFLGHEGSGPIFRPWLIPNIISGPFEVAGLPVVPFRQDHGWIDSVGFRFGPLAYSTDVVDLPEESFEVLQGVEVWVVGCPTDHPHPTHAHVDKVVEWVGRVRPRRCILTHMGPKLDFQTLRRTLPQGIEPGFDGMTVDL